MAVQPQGTKQTAGHARSGPLLSLRRADAAAPPPSALHRAAVGNRRAGRRGRPSRRAPLVAGAVAASVALVTAVVVLTGGDERTSTSPPAGDRPSAAATPGADAGAAAAGRSPEEARAALEGVFAGRAASSTTLLRAVLAGDTAAIAAAATELDASGDELESVVAEWGGADLAIQVRSDLDAQVAAGQAYAAAVRDADRAAAESARADMDGASQRLGRTLDEVTVGAIATYVPPQDAGRLRAFVDALAAQDTAEAAVQAQWLRERLGREGTALARSLTARG